MTHPGRTESRQLLGAPGLSALPDPALSRALQGSLGVDAVVTTREGGASTGPYSSLNLALHVGDDPGNVIENRRRALTLLGGHLDELVLPGQVHGGSVATVTREDRGRGARARGDTITGADALVTGEPGVVLGILVADCLPILLVDPEARVLACAHAGWRGTAIRVVDSTLAAMSDLGAVPARLTAYVGPGVAARDYQVDRPVAEAVRRCLRGGDTGLQPDGSDRWYLDLAVANRRLLLEAGVTPGRIHTSRYATADPRLFSHRRSRGRPCGRFALLAKLRP